MHHRHGNINVFYPNSLIHFLSILAPQCFSGGFAPSSWEIWDPRCWKSRHCCPRGQQVVFPCVLCRYFSVFSPPLFRNFAYFFLWSLGLQILGKTVRLDKGHNCKWASSDRHNGHPGCSVLPILPYDSPVQNWEVRRQLKISLRNHRWFLSRYRTTEGTCNNLENPNWAMAMNGHHRSS